jgi:hypothetical protein
MPIISKKLAIAALAPTGAPAAAPPSADIRKTFAP